MTLIEATGGPVACSRCGRALSDTDGPGWGGGGRRGEGWAEDLEE